MSRYSEHLTVVSRTFPRWQMERILRNHKHFLCEGHFQYPADDKGAHLLRFCTVEPLVKRLPFLVWIELDIDAWIRAERIQYDVVFAPNEHGTKRIVEALGFWQTGKRSVFWEYLPGGRFGDHLVEGSINPGDRVLVFNGVTQTGRCVGQRLPSFVEALGGQVVAAAVFAKGTGDLVKECELKYGSKFYSAIQVDIPVYAPQDCPRCKAGDTASLRPWTELLRKQ